MTFDEAKGIRSNYPGGPCKHQEVAKESIRGWKTGDLVCKTCGEEFPSYQEWQRQQASDQKKA